MFAYLYRTLYGVLLQPNDDFFTRCRKLVVTCYFVFGTIQAFTTTVGTLTTSEWTILEGVTTALSYLESGIWIALWMYAKFTRTIPDWLMNLVIDLNLFIRVVLSFSSPNWSFHAFCCLSLAVMIFVMLTSHMKLHTHRGRLVAVLTEIVHNLKYLLHEESDDNEDDLLNCFFPTHKKSNSLHFPHSQTQNQRQTGAEGCRRGTE